MKSKEEVVEKVKEYFNELGLSIKCSTHTWRKDPTRQEPLIFLTESFFINRTHGNQSCELAIAVCKAAGIVEDGYSELQTHINDGQTMLRAGTTGIAGTPLGILANSDNPDEWFFYQYYNPDIYMSDSELKQINRETFEKLVIARADWVMEESRIAKNNAAAKAMAELPKVKEEKKVWMFVAVLALLSLLLSRC